MRHCAPFLFFPCLFLPLAVCLFVCMRVPAGRLPVTWPVASCRLTLALDHSRPRHSSSQRLLHSTIFMSAFSGPSEQLHLPTLPSFTPLAAVPYYPTVHIIQKICGNQHTRLHKMPTVVRARTTSKNPGIYQPFNANFSPGRTNQTIATFDWPITQLDKQR